MYHTGEQKELNQLVNTWTENWINGSWIWCVSWFLVHNWFGSPLPAWKISHYFMSWRSMVFLIFIHMLFPRGFGLYLPAFWEWAAPLALQTAILISDWIAQHFWHCFGYELFSFESVERIWKQLMPFIEMTGFKEERQRGGICFLLYYS